MEQKSNKIGKNTRKSATEWSELLNIRILELGNAFRDAEEFNNRLLLYEEFLNLAAQCKVEKKNKDIKMTRRDAFLARQELMNKLKN